MDELVTIYHNPGCGTSRNTLALIRASGFEPRVIEYLKTPPDRDTLRSLIARTGEPARNLLRVKEAIWEEMNLDAADLATGEVVDLMLAHPILMNRPLVVTSRGVKLCRPPELVLALLPDRPGS